MASTTTGTVVWLASWENARSAHGPTLAMWIRSECPNLHRDHPSIARAMNRIDEPDAYLDFWKADEYITALELHPAMAPLETWSHQEPMGGEEERRRERLRKRAKAAQRRGQLPLDAA